MDTNPFHFRFSQLAVLRHNFNMSRQRLIISSLVIERLKAIKTATLGQLLGVKEDDALSVLGLSVKITSKQQEDGSKVLDTHNYDIITHLPGNLNAVAGFVVSSDSDGKELEEKFFETDSKLTPVLLTLNLDTQEITAKIEKDGKYEKVDYEIPNESYWDKFIHFRVIVKLDVSYQFNHQSIEKALTSAKKRINQDLAIQLKGTNVYIFPNGADGKGITDKTTVEDLRSLADSKLHFQDKRVLVCGLLLKNDSSELDAAPVITHVRESVKWAKNYISIDALSIVNVKTKVSKLHGIILESVRRCITLNESLLLKDIEEPTSNEKTVPRIYHFLPSSIGHFITVAYKINSPDENNKPFREKLHQKLLLPMNRPFFRSANEHWWVETVGSSKESKILTNPHIGLNPSGVVGGTVSMVQGRYDYHHYMQDGMDDNGWGCAYRSIQTIVSWYRHQGLYNKPIPTHKEIQQALVSHGDKPSSFVGSTQWIGSIEVSFALESLLNVSSRIMRVNSGDEMAMKGGELSHHFKTQGTPVMIGGGVLAHTILGVDYNKKTGDLKFLVLDPHYTGEEDLSVIQGKGWCGWKGIDFWKKGHFYNMCLPQKPNELNY